MMPSGSGSNGGVRGEAAKMTQKFSGLSHHLEEARENTYFWPSHNDPAADIKQVTWLHLDSALLPALYYKNLLNFIFFKTAVLLRMFSPWPTSS
jgi:hypothetical protein